MPSSYSRDWGGSRGWGGPPNFIKWDKTFCVYVLIHRVLVLVLEQLPGPAPPPFRNPISAPESGCILFTLGLMAPQRPTLHIEWDKIGWITLHGDGKLGQGGVSHTGGHHGSW